MEKDFTISVSGQNFRTNRQCLENTSDYFAAMFASTCWKENLKDHIELHDIDPETVLEVIDFCETASVNISEQNATKLLAASDMLQIAQLKDRLECYFLDGLRHGSAKDIPATFTIADTYNCPYLKECCIKLATWCFNGLVDLLSTSDYQLVRCLVKSDFLHSDENIVYKAVMEVTRGRTANEVAPLIDDLYLKNVDQPSSYSLQLLRSLSEDSATRSGFRKDALTLGFISDDDILYAWDRRSTKLKRITNLPTRATGCVIVPFNQFLYFLGGEGRIGYGGWNMDVYRFDHFRKSWEVVQGMDTQRRSCQTLVVNGQIIMFQGYGKYRIELDTVSVLDPSTNHWFRTQYSSHRVLGPPYRTIVYFDNCFYHFVDTATVYRLSGGLLNLSMYDRLRIDTELDTITHAFVFHQQVLVLTTRRRVILWSPADRRTEYLELVSPDCEFHSCTLIDRTLYSVDLLDTTISEFIVDLDAKVLRRVAVYAFLEGEASQGLPIRACCTLPYF